MSICSLFECLWFNRSGSESTATKRLRVQAKAREVKSCYNASGRSLHYFSELKGFLQHMDNLESHYVYIKLEEFGFSQQVEEDIRQIRGLRHASAKKSVSSLENEIKHARNNGIPIDVIEDSINEIVDDDETLNTYLQQAEKECSTCLETYLPSDLLTKNVHRTACGHFYHRSCFENLQSKWRKDHCPMCRTKWTLPQDTDRWSRYLDKIQVKIKALFSDVAAVKIAPDDVFEDDETVARRIQHEYDQDMDERRLQEERDCLFAQTLII